MSPDLDETARLVLMEIPASLREFFDRLREEHPAIASSECFDFWAKYRGWDGRTRPTHDYVTGKPLSRTP